MKMMRLATVAASILIAAALVGCEKGDSSGEIDTSLGASGTVVSRIALIDALWGLAEEPDPDAQCLAESSFTIDQTNGTMIMKNPEPTEYNMAEVIVVSSINIAMLDPETDGRGQSCGDGELYYIVAAGEESPIDIATSEDVAGQHSIEAMAEETPTPYPDNNCKITMHFERQGAGAADAEEDEATATEEEEVYQVEMEADAEVDEDEITEEEEQDDEPVSDETPVYSLKLVIDDYDCRANADEFTARGQEQE